MKSLVLSVLVFACLLPSVGQERPPVHDVEPKEAAGLVQEQKVTVVDIRTPSEYKAGHIAGAKNFDFHSKDFEKNLSTLDKTKPVLVHCASGGRSARSLDLFKKLGFQKIYHLPGGFKAWEKTGQPVEK